MANPIIVLLDLVGTVIDDWDNREFVEDNIPRIKNVFDDIKRNNFKFKAGVYSYAIWCINNLKILKNEIIPELEQRLEILFDDDYIFHMDDLLVNFANKHTGIDYRAYCHVVNKEMSIIDFQKNNAKFIGNDIMLIDTHVTHSMVVTIPENTGVKSIIFMQPRYLKTGP